MSGLLFASDGAVVTGYDGEITGTLVIPEGVTTIQSIAFFGRADVTAVTFPSTLTTIQSSAFQNCSNLTSVHIPSSVTTIESTVFAGCWSLASVTFDASCNLTSFSQGLFQGCGFSSFTIPSTITQIGPQVFSFCGSLTSITIPSSVTLIESEAFAGSYQLASVTLTSGLETIGNYVFMNCTALTSFTAPNTLTGLGQSTFQGCTGLTMVDLRAMPSTNIYTDIFNGCTSLSTVYLPPWYSVGNFFILSGTAVTNLIFPTGIMTMPNISSFSSMNFTSFDLSGCTNITEIPSTYFQNYTSMTSIILPSGLLAISSSAFEGCTGLSSLTMPNSVTTINTNAFKGCTGLTSLTLPNSVTFIGASAFENCTGLTSLTLPSSVTSIGDNAFRFCTELTTLTVGGMDVTFGQYVFGDCTKLTSVTLESGLTRLGYGMFATCTELTSITMPNTVTELGDIVFANCSKLASITLSTAITNFGGSPFSGTVITTLTLPSTLTAIPDGMFSGCGELTSLTIPSTVTTIGENAFASCPKLTSLSIPSGVTSIGGGAFSYSGLTSLTLPSGITTIADYLFQGCTGLTSLLIPSGVTSIGASAFRECTGLTSLVIPSGVTSIGASAFRNCYGFTAIPTLPSGVTTIEESTFQDCSGLTGLTIPSSITTLGPSAFQGCVHIPAVTIPSTLTTIGANAFSGCTGLLSANLSAIVQVDGGTVLPATFATTMFSGCSALTSITLPAWMEFSAELILGTGVTHVVVPAFQTTFPMFINNSAIVSVDISACTFTEVPAGAFSGCWALTAVKLPSTVTMIGDAAFTGVAFTSFTIPSTVTSIGTGLFQGTPYLTSVTFPSGITTLPVGIFNSSGIQTYNFPTITAIGEYAFYGCYNMKAITLPSIVTSIGINAFESAGLTSVLFSGNAPTVEANSFPATALMYYTQGSTGWGEFPTFGGKFQLTNANQQTVVTAGTPSALASALSTLAAANVPTVTVPAFNVAALLTSVDPNLSAALQSASVTFVTAAPGSTVSLPASPAAGEALYFRGDPGQSYTLSAGAQSVSLTLGESAVTVNGTSYAVGEVFQVGSQYYRVAGLGSVVLVATEVGFTYDGSGTTILSGYTGMPAPSTLVIPAGVTAIAANAFKDQTGITTIDFSAATGLLSIGDNAFEGCTSLTQAVVPSGVTTLGNEVFKGCTGITFAGVPSSVTSCGTGTYYGCSALASVVFTPTVTALPVHTFADCSSLVEVNYNSDVEEIGGGAFVGCAALRMLLVPASVTTVGENAFYGLSSLTLFFLGMAPIFTNGSIPSGTVVALNDNAQSFIDAGIPIVSGIGAAADIIGSVTDRAGLRGAIVGLRGSGAEFEMAGFNLGACLSQSLTLESVTTLLANATGKIYTTAKNGTVTLPNAIAQETVYYIPGDVGDSYTIAVAGVEGGASTTAGTLTLTANGVTFGSSNYGLGQTFTIADQPVYVAGRGSVVLVGGSSPLATLTLSYTSKTTTTITFTVTSSPLPAANTVTNVGGYTTSYDPATGVVVVSGLTANTSYGFVFSTSDVNYNASNVMTAAITTDNVAEAGGGGGGGGITTGVQLAVTFVSATSSSLTFQAGANGGGFYPANLSSDIGVGNSSYDASSGLFVITDLAAGTQYGITFSTTDSRNFTGTVGLSQSTLSGGGGGGGGGGDVPPCFLGSARVEMADGSWRRIRDLADGDKVAAAEGGAAAVTRVIRKTVTAGPDVNPYVIPAGQWGARRRLLISPAHCVAVPGRGMVAARDLDLVQADMEGTFDYYNVEVEGNGNICVEGVEVESLAPIRRMVVTKEQFVALVKAKYGDRPLSEVQRMMARTCRVLPDGRMEIPVMRK